MANALDWLKKNREKKMAFGLLMEKNQNWKYGTWLQLKNNVKAKQETSGLYCIFKLRWVKDLILILLYNL